MSDVIFDEEPETQRLAPYTMAKKKNRGLIAWLLKSQLATNERQANIIMLCIALAAIVTTAVIFVINHRAISKPTPVQQQFVSQMPHA